MARKIGKLDIEINLNKKRNTMVGDVTFYKKGDKISQISFVVDELAIIVDWMETRRYYRRRGYGAMMIEIVKGFAQILNLPVILYSLGNVIDFHKKNEFVSMTDPKMKKRIITVNQNPKLKAYEWEDEDLIWLPKKLKHKCKIRLNG